ncbi:MAG: HAD family hydrolase [Verrucomicrobiota bacterium]
MNDLPIPNSELPTAVSKKLLLWDIDGTLVWTGRAGEYAMNRGFEVVFGHQADVHAVDYAGRTDRWIFRALINHYGKPDTDESLARFQDAYLSLLKEELPLRNGYVYEGILELLNWAENQEGIQQALLTGNLQAGAKSKLSHYQLWEYFPFGAFADDSELRNDLGPAALDRAEKQLGVRYDPSAVYVIGDTPHDIEVAKKTGTQAVAVATGKYSIDELAAHEPDFLFEDFSDVTAVQAALGY